MNRSETASGGLREQTLLVRGGLERSRHDETSEALYLTSGYVYPSAGEASAAFAGDSEHYIYSRYGNPTLTMLERRLALVEGAEACRTTATGMAAVFAALACQLRTGERVVASRALFGSCLHILTDILPRWGIETRLVDGTNPDEWREALARPTKAVFLETPSNPTLEIVDIGAVAAMAHAAGARVVVDNVFATPLLQRPLELGADIVVYSTTKHIDGQGRCLGGAVLADEAFVRKELLPFLRHTGPAMSPFNAWVMLKGLETLTLRVERHCANARAVARFLATQPGLERVIHPSLETHPQRGLASRQMADGGSVVSFSLGGGQEAAFRFLDALELIDISNNLGDAKSLITHPATTTHSRLDEEERAAIGIDGGLMRLSVGLEHVDDLLDDLARGLERAAN